MKTMLIYMDGVEKLPALIVVDMTARAGDCITRAGQWNLWFYAAHSQLHFTKMVLPALISAAQCTRLTFCSCPPIEKFLNRTTVKSKETAGKLNKSSHDEIILTFHNTSENMKLNGVMQGEFVYVSESSRARIYFTPKYWFSLAIMFQELLLDRNLLSAVPSSSLNGPKVLKAITLSHNRIGVTNFRL